MAGVPTPSFDANNALLCAYTADGSLVYLKVDANGALVVGATVVANIDPAGLATADKQDAAKADLDAILAASDMGQCTAIYRLTAAADGALPTLLGITLPTGLKSIAFIPETGAVANWNIGAAATVSTPAVPPQDRIPTNNTLAATYHVFVTSGAVAVELWTR